jgi:hypothetical protein
MADNIKIVGEILNQQQVSRYDANDVNLLSPQTLKEDFGQQNDYIEYFVYDAGGNLLNVNYNYKDFKLPSTSYVDPVNGALPIIEIDPIKDLQNLGYSSGEFVVNYSFFNNIISNPSESGLFVKEISADRTEIRVGSTILTNQQIEDASLNIINSYVSSSYFVDYIVDFGNNQQSIITNTALNKIDSGYEILFKLYHPLSVNIQEKQTLWVVKEKANPYVFDINLDKFIIPSPGPQLRGPNFDIEVPNKNNLATEYSTYSNLLNNLQNVSSSYQQLLSLITSQSIDINVDYTNFTNFIFFSSAKQRLVNFYSKVKEIEDYKNLITTYSPLTSSRPNLINDINVATSSINNSIANFDGYEYYLYFESSSYAWPKTTSTLPYTLASTSSATSWYNSLTSSADSYDSSNPNNLIYTIPTFIKDDTNNAPYLTFLNMVGHYFDNIWIFLQAVTDINLANNNLEQGVSKDLVYDVLKSFGTKLYNRYGDSSNDLFLIGQNSGSVNFDNNFTPTGSYLNNIPRKDLLAETYKRIYHNLPLLLKTKGTTYGLQTLISTFGITGSILKVKEYGGDLKLNMLDEYNNDKIRIVSSSIVTGSVLSPYIKLENIPVSTSLFRTNDTHYVDISFSPETQIDTYASASIAVANPTWSLDDYIGDPRQLYSSSYSDLNTQKNTYYTFTGSRMDYAGFIRLIQFFDNSLFKMLKDYVPARANLSTGITISSPVLERNKWSYSNPSSASKLDTKEGTIEGPSIGTEYTDLYNELTGSRIAYYNGELPSSSLNVYSYFKSASYNPYLTSNTASWNNAYPSNSINLNTFLHSNFNVLFNNVSSSRLSATRQDIEYVFGTTQSILSPAYLQDSYESLQSYQLSRYGGVKLSSLYYNNYSSASSTYDGDTSYGKTAAIDINSRKLGLFTNILSSSYLPNRNKVALKYLVDEYGNLTELNQRNKHWEEVQNTFVAGDYLNVSQFDNQKFSNQKTTDGNKIIFDSGYSYYPILYFPSCSATSGYSNISFQNQGNQSAYLVVAQNSSPYTVTGSGTPSGFGHPLLGGYIDKIFDSEIQDNNNIFTLGSTLTPCTYSVAQTGQYKVYANMNLDIVLPSGNSTTWSLELWKNGTLLESNTQQAYFGNLTANCTEFTITNSGPGDVNFTYYNCIDGSESAGRVKSGFSRTICTRGEYPVVTPDYGTSYTVTPGGTCGSPYTISGSTTQSLAFTIDDGYTNTNYKNLVSGDWLSVRLKHVYTSTGLNNATINTNAGMLNIGSLALSTGYSTISCNGNNNYILTTSTSSITFNSSITSFYNGGNYMFVPNPTSGSTNALYDIYGDVDYNFVPKENDILILYLSDDTIVEYSITKVRKNTNGTLLVFDLNSPLSSTAISDLANNTFKRFLLLTRIEDETSAYLTFLKRPGDTSYGLVSTEGCG